MTRQITLGAMSADHVNQVSHVTVEIWDLVSDGIRRRVDKFEMSFEGASIDPAIVKPAVLAGLLKAGLAEPYTEILTQSEARP